MMMCFLADRIAMSFNSRKGSPATMSEPRSPLITSASRLNVWEPLVIEMFLTSPIVFKGVVTSACTAP